MKSIFNNIDNKIICKAVFPILLVIYSMLLVNQGITTTDTGYCYNLYEYFDELSAGAKLPTYLSCVLGHFFTKLPYGHTVLGLNIYTGLVKLIIAIVSYIFFVKYIEINPFFAFWGEIVALGYCWCPSAVLYNYATYLLFNVGSMLLYVAIVKEKNILFYLAGVILGLNIFVRFPNIAEAALIVVLWSYCVIKRKELIYCVKKTMICIAGYVSGIAVILLVISARYGLAAYFKSVFGLFELSGQTDDYSVINMILNAFKEYIRHFTYLKFSFLFFLIGLIIFSIKSGRGIKLKRNIYIMLNIVLYFIFLKQEMFTLEFYEYDAMYSVGVYFLIFTLMVAIYNIFFEKQDVEYKVLSAIVLIIILITPLGSNNVLLSPINNMFLIFPYMIQCCFKICKKQSVTRLGKVYFDLMPVKITLIFTLLMATFHGACFGTQFVYRDGMNGIARGYKVDSIPALKGMYTTSRNGEQLSELYNYLDENSLIGESVILYKDIPGIAFYMGLKPAIETTWPDLETYSYSSFSKQLDIVAERIDKTRDKPLIIIGVIYDSNEEKIVKLRSFIEEYNYRIIFENDFYHVYR